MDQTILVTGANGYLGTYICKQLLSSGHRVTALKFDHYASNIIEHPGIRYLHCDITKNIDEQIGREVEAGSVKALVNAAALLGSSDYDKNYAVNALGVHNLMDFCDKKGIRRFIQISSVVILKPFKGPYGETKLIGQEFLETSDLDYTVFIPAMILGPEGLGINRILKNVFRIPFIVPLVGYGRQTQHPIFVKDFTTYIVRSIDSEAAFGKTYQIAGDEVVSFRNFIAMVLKIKKRKKFFLPVPPALVKMMGKGFQKFQKVPLFTAEHVKGVMQDSRLDTSALKNDLHFKPTPLEDALRYSLDKIGNNWNYYLRPREEKRISI